MSIHQSLWRMINGGKTSTTILPIFTIYSDGRTAETLVRDLEQKGFRVSASAEDMMGKPQFVTTRGTTYSIGFIRGNEFTDAERITKNIRKEAKRRGWLSPPAECAPLAREQISDKNLKRMGLRCLVMMHEPIEDFGGIPKLLGLDCSVGGRWLRPCYGRPDGWWSRRFGFGFLIQQYQ